MPNYEKPLQTAWTKKLKIKKFLILKSTQIHIKLLSANRLSRFSQNNRQEIIEVEICPKTENI